MTKGFGPGSEPISDKGVEDEYAKGDEDVMPSIKDGDDHHLAVVFLVPFLTDGGIEDESDLTEPGSLDQDEIGPCQGCQDAASCKHLHQTGQDTCPDI